MWVRMLCVILLSAISFAQTVTHRTNQAPPVSARDQKIQEQAQKLLAGHDEFRRVHISAEDRVLTLTGTVELASDRQWLGDRMKGIKDVSSVSNQLVLDPPAMADEVLLARVRQALDAPHFAAVKFTVHEGLVKLSGTVRTQGDASRAVRIVDSTRGVREVESEIRVAESN